MDLSCKNPSFLFFFQGKKKHPLKVFPVVKVSMPCCENSECVALQFTIRLESDSVSLLVEAVKSVLDSN